MDNVRFLVLDDDPLITETISLMAQSLGAVCRATEDPVAFFQLLAEWKPTHIYIDLNMPEMDGLQVMCELGRRHCKALIIVSSGINSRVLDASARAAQGNGLAVVGVLSKPFKMVDLKVLLQTKTPAVKTSTSVNSSWFVPLADDLLNALEQGQIQSFFQPKVNSASGLLTGFEALARWQHPEHGVIMPNLFIPLAESEGLIDRLTEQVLTQALDWFVPWSTEHKRDQLTISINISARSFNNQVLFDRLLEICADRKLPPALLIFELTETAAMEEPMRALELLTRLRVRGFHLSIDDFGTGFSSVVQLVRLPFSELKVDRSFVVNVVSSEESRNVVRFMIDLARSLGLSVTAEGVEDETTRLMLAGMGCDTSQGFGIGRPIPGKEMNAWFDKWMSTLGGPKRY